VKTISDKILYHSLWAQYWMHSASNGHCQRRQLFHGTKDDPFTKQEKIDDAMQAAENHIRLIAEILDKDEGL
jgi:hypothetical protein